MDSIHIILRCPSKNKDYNIQITEDVTPIELEQEFKEQCFNKEDKFRFYYNGQLLKHNVPLMKQQIVKGSILDLLITFTANVSFEAQKQLYTVEIDNFMTTTHLFQHLQPILEVRSDEVSFFLAGQILKPDIPLIQQKVKPNSTITANIQQKGGLDF